MTKRKVLTVRKGSNPFTCDLPIMSAPSISGALRTFCDQENERIRSAFESYHDGRAVVRERTALVESVCTQLWRSLVAPAPEESPGFCLAAIGGFGRRALFPASDIDLLFLCADTAVEESRRTAIRAFCQELWDLRLRVSPATRLLTECGRLDYDNIEFTISLLDCRYLAGDPQLFARLREKVLPGVVIRERQPLVQRLSELSRARHAKYGNTIFQLEPNIKETPGGLRDYNLASWLSLISACEKRARHAQPEVLFPPPLRDESTRALDFLLAVRCFLHYRAGRDDNALSWEAQDEAASLGVGTSSPGEPGVWMRNYFRHARAISRLATHLLDEVPPARSSLYQQYQHWRSRLSNADFSVVHGRIYLQQPSAIGDIDLVMRLFGFMARHGLKLSADVELRLARVLPSIVARPPAGAQLWAHLRQILALHALGLLVVLLPEFRGIDALVIRDFYHRYTVDEHTFTAIETVHGLRQPAKGFEECFTALLQEIERPELLFLALLLHDVGKGMPTGSHVEAGMHLVESATARLQLEPDERELVRFLVYEHLQISMSLLRRDIFAPETIRALADKVGTTERLKMLCLLTYADIRAVNPEALTPWKAEDIWHLYVQTANYLDHSVDDRRLQGQDTEGLISAHLECIPAGEKRMVAGFVEGLPRRYLLTHSPETIVHHAEMASRVEREAVQLWLEIGAHLHRITILVRDRSGLFANIAGVLAAWGMEIVKADAFSNAAGIVVDTFAFTDPFGTLELNPPERDRFQRSVADVLLGEVSLEQLLSTRRRVRRSIPKPVRPPHVTLDNHSSPHSTILEVVAGDRSGLLYSIASVLAENGCNLDVALIDTQGHLAIDVFYVTLGGKKLDSKCQQKLKTALLEELAAE
jgi:[protein-PII] uridylyltransferase